MSKPGYGRAAALLGEPARRYEFENGFIEKSTKAAMFDCVFSPVALDGPQTVRVKPKFDTACWSYTGYHRIYIGEDLFEKKSVKLGLSEELQHKYVANHYRHEKAHGLFTIRDLTIPSGELKVMKAPFSLWNLFEDALIEDRYRKAAEYKFEWWLMEDAAFIARPEAVMFSLIRHEGNQAAALAEIDAWTYDAAEAGKKDGEVKLDVSGRNTAPDTKSALLAWMPKVWIYYVRTIKAAGSMALMPLIKAWVEEFGVVSGRDANAMCDLGIGFALQTDEDFQQEFDQFDETSESEDLPKVHQFSEDVPVSAQGKVLSPDKGPKVHLDEVGAVVEQLKKFFQVKLRNVSSRMPQKRISARHLAVGRSPYRKTELQGKVKQDILLVVDCSGSMNGFHISQGRVLVAALSELAASNSVSGHVVLSGVLNRNPIHETYKLPVSMETISRISAAYAAEGLQAAIQANIELARKADHVFVYTDGEITDRPIDKAKLHVQGIHTWGLYAGSTDKTRASLMLYFDKAVVRRTAAELVDAMLAQIK